MAKNRSTSLRDEIIARINKDNNLLSLPQTLYQILNEVDKEDFSPQKLSEIVKADPSLAVRILSLANSTFYQRFAKTTTVNQAISVLGISTVRYLALSSSVLKPELIAKNSGIDPKDFFTYVLLNAATAEGLARELSFKSSEEAFIIGLLNDIGLIFMLHHYPDKFRQALDLKGKVDSLQEAEKQVFGIDHYEISHLLAKKWKLPEEMANAIGFQKIENPGESTKKMQETIKLAGLMNPENFSGFTCSLEDRLSKINEIAAGLSLSREQLGEVTSKIMPGAIEVAEHLNIDIGSVEDLLIKANQEIWKAYFTIEQLLKVRQDLNDKLFKEERSRGTLEAKNTSMATLFHYVNNAIMAIYGRSQMMRHHQQSGQTELLLENLDKDIDIIEKSVQKVVAVLEEVKEISPIDQSKLSGGTEAMDLDDRLLKRLENMNSDSKWSFGSEKKEATTK